MLIISFGFSNIPLFPTPLNFLLSREFQVKMYSPHITISVNNFSAISESNINCDSPLNEEDDDVQHQQTFCLVSHFMQKNLTVNQL